MSLLQKIKAKSIQPAVLIAQRIKAECSSCSRDAWDAKAAQDLCSAWAEMGQSQPGLQFGLCGWGGNVSREQQHKGKLCIN